LLQTGPHASAQRAGTWKSRPCTSVQPQVPAIHGGLVLRWIRSSVFCSATTGSAPEQHASEDHVRRTGSGHALPALDLPAARGAGEDGRHCRQPSRSGQSSMAGPALLVRRCTAPRRRRLPARGACRRRAAPGAEHRPGEKEKKGTDSFSGKTAAQGNWRRHASHRSSKSRSEPRASRATGNASKIDLSPFSRAPPDQGPRCADGEDHPRIGETEPRHRGRPFLPPVLASHSPGHGRSQPKGNAAGASALRRPHHWQKWSCPLSPMPPNYPLTARIDTLLTPYFRVAPCALSEMKRYRGLS